MFLFLASFHLLFSSLLLLTFSNVLPSYLQAVAAAEYRGRENTAMSNLSDKLLAAANNFENSYTTTLDKQDLDAKTHDALYDLGATIRHLVEEIAEAVE